MHHDPPSIYRRHSGAGPASSIAARLGEASAPRPRAWTVDEAKSRLEKYGRNAIAAKEASRWQKLVGYFWGPIPWMIEAAALISLLRQDWPDFAVVAGLLLYNAAVGFWQDNKAANALAALEKGLALKARRCAASNGSRSTRPSSCRATSSPWPLARSSRPSSC